MYTYTYVSVCFAICSVQLLNCVQLCDPTDCSMPGFPVCHRLLEFAQTHIYWVDDAIWPSHPLLPPSPPAFNLSQHQGLFQRVSSSHQVAKVLSFSFSIGPSNEYSGLISFSMDWLDLFAVQGTLESSPTPKFKSISSSVLSFLYSLALTSMHVRKTMTLTRWTFVGKVMSLLFNMLSRLFIIIFP